MAKKEIVIRIPPNGNVQIDQFGMQGKECSDNIKELISKMGKTVEKERKADFYRKKDVHIDVQR